MVNLSFEYIIQGGILSSAFYGDFPSLIYIFLFNRQIFGFCVISVILPLSNTYELPTSHKISCFSIIFLKCTLSLHDSRIYVL